MNTDFIFNITEKKQEYSLTYISIDQIKPGNFQPRLSFEQEYIEKLASSIKQKGILQPLLIRKLEDKSYEIIAGERRFQAAKQLKMSVLPVLLLNLSDQEALEVALIENLQREALSPIDEGLSIHRLMQEFKLNQSQVAHKLGKKRSTLANLLRLTQLSANVQKLINNNKLSIGHAKVLLQVKDSQLQEKIANYAVLHACTVKQLEKLVQDQKQQSKQKQSNSALYIHFTPKVKQYDDYAKVEVTVPKADLQLLLASIQNLKTKHD